MNQFRDWPVYLDGQIFGDIQEKILPIEVNHAPPPTLPEKMKPGNVLMCINATLY